MTDPEAESALALLRDLGYAVSNVRTIRTYRVDGPVRIAPRPDPAAAGQRRRRAGDRRPADISIGLGQAESLPVPPVGCPDPRSGRRRAGGAEPVGAALAEPRRDATIQAHFATLGRDPTDCELETIAQTWSEHCSHKTLKGRIAFEGRTIDNLLKETIFAATQNPRELGADDWCVSVFEDNAGVVRFDDEYDVCFKVETHNHPSALEPYGGANTGLGGVIRDPLGTGLGAKPICNTDVFCFAPPDTPPEHAAARRAASASACCKGVVAGVRDYGNRMGIPDRQRRRLLRPALSRQSARLLRHRRPASARTSRRSDAEPGDLIVAVGGRTGRDGIHGATFSSAELTARERDASPAAPCRSATPSPRRRCST